MSEQEWTDQFDALLRRSYAIHGTDEKVHVLEAAVRLADHHGDAERGYEARDALISAAVHGGHTEKAVVAFAWCRAQAKKEPSRFGGWHLLWENKWILESLHEHLGVTRAQIESTLDDYAAAVEEQGGSGRSTAKLRLIVAAALGEVEESKRWYRVFRDTRRDAHSDCAACDVCVVSSVHVEWGEHEEALRLGAEVLRGRLACAHVPHDLLPFAALAYFHLDRLPEAKDAFLKGYRITANNRRYLPGMGRFLALLGLTGNHGPALTLFEKHLAWALETRAPFNAIPFHMGARFVLERAVAAGDTQLALWLPKSFPLFREDGIYDARTLLDWTDAQATDLCAKFDARNGNGHYTAELAEARKWGDRVKPYPINTGIG